MRETRRRGWIFTAVALVLALITAFLFFNYLNRLEREIGEKKEVVVAAEDIPARTLIEEGMLRIETLPVKYARSSYLRDIGDAVGRVAMVQLREGDILRGDDVLEARVRVGAGAALESELASQMRAVTIAVDQVTGVGGALVPGSRVDIVVSYAEGENNQTIVLLENKEVLAVGGAFVGMEVEPVGLEEGFEPRRQTGGGGTVTLALSPQEAVRLVFMDNFAKEVRLVLRHRDDKAPQRVQPVTWQDFE